MPDEARIRAALEQTASELLAEIGPEGHWVGELSSSALSTATAVVALAAFDPEQNAALIKGGLRWLAVNVNADGGWGDTVRSKSNISTTALCWAAFGAARADAEFRGVVDRAEGWLDVESQTSARAKVRQTERPHRIAAAIACRYGKDRTFSVPILMTLALAGRLGADGWALVPGLPFELAAVSHRLWGALRLPVVSYALPALIAIGQVIHHHAPTRNPITRVLRAMTRHKTLRVLEAIQPPNGGFLEATPLTSFVTMSLAAMGLGRHAVALKGAGFLAASVRADGSWPIDTNLATWTTTLAIKALAHKPGTLTPEQRITLRDWLLRQQYRAEHPYTHAAPGGWAWTDLPGGVPDADDTAGALLALLRLGTADGPTRAAGVAGVKWLIGLQNRDGGIPTFCRGWGALPFDRSSPDLTAHAIRAWSEWRSQVDSTDRPALNRAIQNGLSYLRKTQRADGAWIPLWFGNESAPHDENPLYGTALVVTALRELPESVSSGPAELAARGADWLAMSQNEDGGWGGVRGVQSSVEETALAVKALVGTKHVSAKDRGVDWLVRRVESGEWRTPSPIGFYFAKLWYSERLYPLIWTVGALGRAACVVR